MKRSNKQKNKKNNRQTLYFFLVIGLLGIGLSVWFSQSAFLSLLSRAQSTAQLICPTPPGQSNLQLLPCDLITPTGGIVPPFDPQNPPPLVNMPPNVQVPPNTGNTCSPDGPMSGSCSCPPYQEPIGGGAGANPQCNSKPIIYLYPTEKTMVDVRLEIPGVVTVSDPLYPNNGWKNIEAYPDGNFIYNGNSYRELYYETATIKANPPKAGIITDMDNLEATMLKMTTELGLNEFEQKEFMEYWLPELKALNSPYMFVSVFDHSEKLKVDHVIISPKPDTMIEFLAYFKPVAAPYPVPVLHITPAPERNGFTAVEWGGTIDK